MIDSIKLFILGLIVGTIDVSQLRGGISVILLVIVALICIISDDIKKEK